MKIGHFFKTVSNSIMQGLNWILAICLAVMFILVFVNVVLRYFFNSGITWSEEMTRFLFIWLTFIGAIVVLKDNEHLGIELFVNKLPPVYKKVAYIFCQILILYCLWLVLEGSWKLTLLNANSYAPATGLPMSYVYGIGVVMSVGMAIIVLYNTFRVLRGQVNEDSLREGGQSDKVAFLD